ncbi:MAG TPA: cysteine desulfurase, partial [Burkholderiaceae bacterium]|nr:cysteine desulfurase [Burkholderiaceae bacterium]
MTIQTPTSDLSGPLDAAALNQLAGAFFAALPGQAPIGAQAPANPLPAGATIGPFGNGPPLPGTLVPGGNALPQSPQDIASIAAAQPARFPKVEAGNGVP